VLSVTDLTATLAGLLTLGPDPSGGEVDDLTIAEARHGIVGQPGDLVLGVGVESTEDAVALVGASAGAGAGGLVLRRSLAARRQVRDRARRDGLALVGLAEQASWAHVVWLLRGVIDRASTTTGDRRGGAPVQDDLFALADAAAALVDAPVTIEDAQSRVLAYSSRQDVTDPARVSTIVGRRVPDEVLASLRARGVFRRLARSSEPVFVPADPNGTLPRLVVPVRAGGEWLGSIWAVVEDRPPAHLVAELVQTSSVVALHLLRLRAQADLSRRVAADRLRGVLSGSTAGADGWLPPGPWRVVCLGGEGGEGGAARLLDLWESVSRRHAWNQPLLADLDDRAYAVVRDADDLSPGTWGWLTAVVERARGESLDLTARAGRTAHTAGELERSKVEALEVERVVGPASTAVPTTDGVSGVATGPVSVAASVVHEDVWAQVTVARAAAVLRGDDVLGPLAVLAAHDREHGSDHLRTLAAWLDHPGAPGRAARSIHVHPNTMRYRMNRIADLAGLQLDEPLVRLALRLQLAALLEPGRGARPPATA
jgi:hypothetical protein